MQMTRKIYAEDLQRMISYSKNSKNQYEKIKN